MIDFVGIPLFLRIALQVALATMHFHIAHSGLLLRNICFPGNNLAPIRNCHGGARYVKLDAGVKGYPHFRAICDKGHPWGNP